MANRFYEPGVERAAKVNDLFARIARRYDFMNDLQSFGLHRLWKGSLVRLAGPCPGARALDVCCGTGDLAFALAGCGAEVVGLDFSEPMLEVAEGRRHKKVKQIATPAEARLNPRFMKGDARELPFPDATFEIVTVAYGLRNLAGWESGLREMARVAKPGGRLFVLDFGKPENALWRGLYFGYLKFFVPVLARLVCGESEAYGYIFESLRHYPAQRGVAAGMKQLGLVNIRIRNLLGGVMSINSGEKPR